MGKFNRQFRLRKSSGLISGRIYFGSRSGWVVSNPLSMEYHRLRNEEHAVLDMLDGKRSLENIRDEFEAAFAPQRIRTEEILRFAIRAHDQGLVVSDTEDQGPRLSARGDKRMRRRRWERWSNPLAIRFRGIDPQRLLNLLYPWLGFVFRRRFVVIAIALMAAALGVVAIHWDEFVDELVGFNSFLTPRSALLLMAVLASVKVLHELLGHGLCCRHFNGKCHELGMMLLMFSPCLYCNVSDSWRFPSKWRRIAVSAAGIYIELILASFAAFGWWLSSAGLFHQLCLAVMFVCSVNTLIFNGNPLLRYDGYFLLAELANEPSLAERSRDVFRALLRWIVGLRPAVITPFFPRYWRERILYGLYRIASVAYRAALTYWIYLWLMSVVRPYHLENVVRVMASAVVGAMVFRMLHGIYRWARVPGASQSISSLRLIRFAAVVSSFVTAICLVPLPQSVFGTIQIELRDSQQVYIDVPGIIVEHMVQAGDRVFGGTDIVRLESLEMEQQIGKLQARCDELRVQLGNLERARFFDGAAAKGVSELRQSLKEAEGTLREMQDERPRLTLKADRNGTVFPAPSAPDRDSFARDLKSFSGRAIERRNLGCALPSGAVYCRIGDPRHWDALVVVDQDDLPLVHVGLKVDIKIDGRPDVVFQGKVDEVSHHEMTDTAQHLSNKTGGDVATQTSDSGAEVPLMKSYQVRVSFDDPDGQLRYGTSGTAKIHVAHETLGARFGRWCSRTFQRKL